MAFKEACALFDNGTVADSVNGVILTNDEINRARRNKAKANKKATGFQNAPIYRSLHASMRLMIEIVRLMPKKTVKISDILLQNYAEMMRWTAAAYNHRDEFLKIHALEESISLMSVVKITLNCMSGLVSESKHKQLNASFDAVVRQLVAWRGSLEQSRGLDANVL